MEAQNIIAQLHDQWLVAKEHRRQICEARNMHRVAEKLAGCTLFKGTENVAELTRLFTSPQGREFCLAANFPNLDAFRQFKSFGPERYGFYIDAGDITLTDPETAVLIGNTTATIRCDKCQRNTIVAMHGAKATVLASGWAVVHAESGPAATVTCESTENAIIL